MVDLDGEEIGQVAIAVGAVLGLLKLQTENKGAIPMAELPQYIISLADEREKHGDFGAARMLRDWADVLKDDS